MSKNRNYQITSTNESEQTMSNNNRDNIVASSSAATEVKPITSSGNVASVAFKNTINVSTQKTETTSAVKEEKVKTNQNVDKLKTLIKDYEDAVNKQNCLDKEKFLSISVMISLCEYLHRNTDPEVFEYFFRYFQQHKDDIMHFSVALRGIHTIQNKMVKTRVGATHTSYEELCRVRASLNGHFKFTINAMKMMCLSETQSKWIIAKAQTRN